MKIQTQIIKKFLDECANIKPDITSSNLDSIKIECTGYEIIFTKTNNRIFLTYTIECAQSKCDAFLINEDVIRGIVITTGNEYVTIERKEKHILIKDGIDTTKCPIEDIKLYPVAPPSNNEETPISRVALECIQIASKYISHNLVVDARNFVNISSNGVFGTNGDIVYYNTCGNEELPEVFFGTDALSILKPVDGATYNRHGNYDFFKFENFNYGFIKSAITKQIPYLPLVQQRGDVSFVFAKNDFINFCKRVRYVSKHKDPICTFKCSHDEKLELSYIDQEFDRDVHIEIMCQTTALIDEFKFSLERLTTVLNSLPYDYLVFTRIGKHYKITSDEDKNYIGIIAGLN